MNNISNLMNIGSIINLIIKYKYVILSFIVISIIGYICYYYNKDIKMMYNSNREYDSSSNKNNTNMNTKNISITNKVKNKSDIKNANIMLFYVDWCPHCKTAKPEWDKVRKTFDNKIINNYMIVFTEYNCTNETSEINELINKYDIQGYPTIKLIKDNQIIDFDAKPTTESIEYFLNNIL